MDSYIHHPQLHRTVVRGFFRATCQEGCRNHNNQFAFSPPGCSTHIPLFLATTSSHIDIRRCSPFMLRVPAAGTGCEATCGYLSEWAALWLALPMTSISGIFDGERWCCLSRFWVETSRGNFQVRPVRCNVTLLFGTLDANGSSFGLRLMSMSHCQVRVVIA